MSERPAPALTEATTAFWSGGADEQLLIQRCDRCEHWQHPPKAMCSNCHGRELHPEASSGRGTVWSYTISRTAWGAIEPPYVVAQVELDEQPGLLLLTALVDADAIEIGMAVVVDFERTGDTWIPVFRPAAGAP